MKKYFLTIATLMIFFVAACKNEAKKEQLAIGVPTVQQETLKDNDSIVYKSEKLIIRRVAEHVYQHISFLDTESFGRVPCNGMIVAHGKEAIIFDTPTDDIGSEELIQYLTGDMTFKIIAVIATHFHADCVGGLHSFHEFNIPSYASNKTIALLEDQNSGAIIPKQGFGKVLELSAGDKKVSAEYFGEGHTKDNIIGYFPYEKAMFGGCLIKETGAGKGNMEDANEKDWPETVRKIKMKYPMIEHVIPGHGQAAGSELLDYTVKLFE